MTMEDYDSINAVRWSRLKAMKTSAKQYQHELRHEREDAKHLKLGRAVHKLVLEGDEAFARDVAIFGGASRRSKAWTEFEAAHEDQDILLGTEAAVAKNMADAVRNDPVAKKHLREGLAEQVIRWDDPDTGIACKCRADLVNGHLVELKSTKNPEPEAFARDAFKYGYHGQIAFYRDGIIASGYALHAAPAMITVSSAEPHDVVVYEIGDDTIEAGKRLYKGLLDSLQLCIENDKWPGISGGRELVFRLPQWALETDEGPTITLGGMAVFSG